MDVSMAAVDELCIEIVDAHAVTTFVEKPRLMGILLTTPLNFYCGNLQQYIRKDELNGALCSSGHDGKILFAPLAACELVLQLSAKIAEQVLCPLYGDRSTCLVPTPLITASENPWTINAPLASCIPGTNVCPVAIISLSETSDIELGAYKLSMLTKGENALLMDARALNTVIISEGVVKLVMVACLPHSKKLQAAWENAAQTGHMDSTIIPCDALEARQGSILSNDEKAHYKPLLLQKKAIMPQVFFGTERAEELSVLQRPSFSSYTQKLESLKQRASKLPTLLATMIQPLLEECSQRADAAMKDDFGRLVKRLEQRVTESEVVAPHWVEMQSRKDEAEKQVKALQVTSKDRVDTLLHRIENDLEAFPKSANLQMLQGDLISLETRIAKLKGLVSEKRKKKKTKKRGNDHSKDEEEDVK